MQQPENCIVLWTKRVRNMHRNGGEIMQLARQGSSAAKECGGSCCSSKLSCTSGWQSNFLMPWIMEVFQDNCGSKQRWDKMILLCRAFSDTRVVQSVTNQSFCPQQDVINQWNGLVIPRLFFREMSSICLLQKTKFMVKTETSSAKATALQIIVRKLCISDNWTSFAKDAMPSYITVSQCNHNFLWEGISWVRLY